jgi:hypothetical protein
MLPLKKWHPHIQPYIQATSRGHTRRARAARRPAASCSCTAPAPGRPQGRGLAVVPLELVRERRAAGPGRGRGPAAGLGRPPRGLLLPVPLLVLTRLAHPHLGQYPQTTTPSFLISLAAPDRMSSQDCNVLKLS